MRRIAMVSEHASPLALAGGVDSGGQNVYVAHLACELARRGYRVDVFTRRDDPAQPMVSLWKPGVRVIHVPAGPARFIEKEALLPMMREFGEFLMRYFERAPRYDVIHANFFMSGLAALAPAQRLGIPLVMTFHALGRVRREHQNGADRFPDLRFAIEDELVRRADRIVAECPQDRDDLVRLYRADVSKIDIVPCGYDPDELQALPRAEARRRLGWNAAEFTLLQLGRLVPRKGVDNVIRSLRPLREHHGIDARLYVAGGDSEIADPALTPEIRRLADIAHADGVSDRLCFLGRRDRAALSALYSAADVFVSTPDYEPFGITPVEAMACGTAVIGSRVGGIRSTIVDGVTGLLVPPRDPQALAASLARLHDDPAFREACGRAGRVRARSEFTWQHVGAEIGRVYRRAARPLPQQRRAASTPATAISL